MVALMPIVESNMKSLFADDVLLDSDYAYQLYKSVKDLPIIDYHCHLDQDAIAHDDKFSDIGEL